jgi:hypothetical protein
VRKRDVLEIEIGGKSVFTFEDHATALVAWHTVRTRTKTAPYLVSFDKHLDTRPAFHSYVTSQFGRDKYREHRKEKIAQISFANAQTIEHSLAHIENDEHIEAALQLGEICQAFVISQSARDGFDDECGSEVFQLTLSADDGSLADFILGPVLDKLKGIRIELVPETTPFILDIDLDFFRAYPPALGTPWRFYELIRDSCAVTIAEEPKYAAPGIQVTKLKKQLLAHIERALKGV